MDMNLLRTLILCSILQYAFGVEYSPKTNGTTRLVSDLLDSYAINVRPGLQTEARINVTVTYNLISISEISEVKSYASFLGFMYVNWTDERMQWDPDEYAGITELTFSSQMVWVPPLIVGNPSDSVLYFRDVKTEVIYDNHGNALWSPGSVSKTYCSMNVYVYPFDTQNCSILIVAEGVLSHYINLTHALPNVVLGFYSENSEWDLESTWTESKLQFGYMTLLHFHFKLVRKPEFLVVNLLLPLICISFLSTMVFLLPAESGERISFSVTMFLSYSVFITFIGQSVPKVSNPAPLLCYYILFLLVSSGTITAAAILNLKLHHNQSNTKTQTMCDKFTKCLNRKKNAGKTNDQHIADNDRFNFEYSLETNHNHKECQFASAMHETNLGMRSEVNSTWTVLAVVLDRILVCVFTVINSAVLAGVIWTMRQATH